MLLQSLLFPTTPSIIVFMRKRPFIIPAAVIVFSAAVFSGCTSTVVSVGSSDPGEYFGVSDDSRAALVLDGEVCGEQGIVEDGTIFIPWSFVWDEIDAGFYYENDSGTLYYTGEDGELSWTANDENALVIRDEEAYVSAEVLTEYSHAEVSVFEDPDRAVIWKPDQEVGTVKITKDTALYSRAGDKGYLTDMEKGDEVVYLSDEDGFSRVSTDDGFTGYVKNDCIGELQSRTTGSANPASFDKISFGSTVRMIWDFIEFTSDNDYFDAMLANVSGVNAIAPTWYTLDNSGGMSSLSGAGYVQKAHARGIDVWPVISDLSIDADDVGRILGSRDSRERIISSLMAEADACGFDGINVDFEHVSEKDAPAFIQFIRELTAAAHAKDLIVSVNDYVPQYTGYYKRSAQIGACDYIAVMAYDEYTGSSKEPGSAASLPFVVQGIEDTLKEVPAEYLILGVPFYSRAWTQNFGEEECSSQALDMESARNFISEHNITPYLYWDKTCGQYYGTSTDDQARYSIWQEEEQSLGEKLKLVNEYSLAGAAAWRLGYEEDAVWTVWNEILT